MADGTRQTPSPSDVAARAQANAPSAQGDMDRVCLPCSGQVAVEANYTDAWFTRLTNGAVSIEDPTGIVVAGSMVTEPLAAHGQKDGDASTAPLTTMGTTPPVKVAWGRDGINHTSGRRIGRRGHDRTFPRYHHVGTATTKPSPFTRHPSDFISQFGIITSARQIPNG